MYVTILPPGKRAYYILTCIHSILKDGKVQLLGEQKKSQSGPWGKAQRKRSPFQREEPTTEKS